jgi:uncharacterized alpha-E superfamily protein
MSAPDINVGGANGVGGNLVESPSVNTGVSPGASAGSGVGAFDGKRLFGSRAARPMLSRDADSMYWMSRYVERAEHVARLLFVNGNLLIDVGDLAPALQERQWLSVINILRLDEADPALAGAAPMGDRVARHMTFNASNPSSLISCVTRARENARSIRENISAEMWENLNSLYWSIRGDDARARFEESPEEFYRSVMTASMLFQGLTDQTMPHDQRWLFTQVAKYLERIDVTCRVIETKFNILKGAETMLETALRNIHWMAVLRSCCSIEAFRRNHFGEMDPLRVAAFLILEREFPRSIRFSVQRAVDAVAAIHISIDPNAVDPAERVLGRLNAQLEYAEMTEILNEGLPAYLQRIQSSVAEAALAVQKAYFLN